MARSLSVGSGQEGQEEQEGRDGLAATIEKVAATLQAVIRRTAVASKHKPGKAGLELRLVQVRSRVGGRGVR